MAGFTDEQTQFLATMAQDYDNVGEKQSVAIDKFLAKWPAVTASTTPLFGEAEEYRRRVLAAYKRQRRKVNLALKAAGAKPGENPAAQAEAPSGMPCDDPGEYASEHATVVSGTSVPPKFDATGQRGMFTGAAPAITTAPPSAQTPRPVINYGQDHPPLPPAPSVRVVRDPLVPERPLMPSTSRPAAARTLVGVGPQDGPTIDFSQWALTGTGQAPTVRPGARFTLGVDADGKTVRLIAYTRLEEPLALAPRPLPTPLADALAAMAQRTCDLTDAVLGNVASNTAVTGAYADAIAAKDGEIETLKKYVAYLERQVGAR